MYFVQPDARIAHDIWWQTLSPKQAGRKGKGNMKKEVNVKRKLLSLLLVLAMCLNTVSSTGFGTNAIVYASDDEAESDLTDSGEAGESGDTGSATENETQAEEKAGESGSETEAESDSKDETVVTEADTEAGTKAGSETNTEVGSEPDSEAETETESETESEETETETAAEATPLLGSGANAADGESADEEATGEDSAEGESDEEEVCGHGNVLGACAECIEDMIDALPDLDELKEQGLDLTDDEDLAVLNAIYAEVNEVWEAYYAYLETLEDETEDAVGVEKIEALTALSEYLSNPTAISEDAVAQIGEETYASVSAAIEAVEDGTQTTITMLADSTENITIASGQNIVLDLAGYTLTGADESGSVITVNGTFTLNDSAGAGVVTGGNAEEGGGVYVAEGCSFTMNGGTISGNTAEYGGGVYVESNNSNKSTFTMNGGSISSNEATAYGGGIYLHGYATFYMSGGTVSTNTSVYNGGGIYSNQNYVSMYFSGGSVITENEAGDSGGGICMDGYYGIMQFTDQCIVSKNYAVNGAGIYSKASTVSAEGLTVSGNIGNGSYGALYLSPSSSCTITLTNVTIKENENTNSGGNVGLYVKRNSGSNTFKATNCTIEDNTSANNGSIAYIYINPADETAIQWTNCTFSGNEGGDILHLEGTSGGIINLQECTIKKNTSVSAVIYSAMYAISKFSNCPVIDNIAGTSTITVGGGGRIYFDSCEISGNTAAGNAGAIDVSGTNTVSKKTTYSLAVLTDTVITANTGNLTGGVYGPLNMTGGALYNNVSKDGYAANDWKIDVTSATTDGLTTKDGTSVKITVPFAWNMSDSETDLSSSIWYDTTNSNQYSKSNIETLSAEAGGSDFSAMNTEVLTAYKDNTEDYYYLTVGDPGRMVAEYTDGSEVRHQFATIAEAIEAVQELEDYSAEKYPITLIAGEDDNSGYTIVENLSLESGTDVTIDLNGRILKGKTADSVITVASGATLTLIGDEDENVTGSAVESSKASSAIIENSGTLTIDGAVTVSSISNSDSGKLEISGSSVITAIENAGKLEISAAATVSGVENSGTMTVSGAASIDSITNTGSLTISNENASVTSISHSGSLLLLTANTVISEIELAENAVITATGDFAPDTITITLSDSVLAALNSYENGTTVTLIQPYGEAVLSDSLLDAITIQGVNGLVKVEKEDERNIIARTATLNGVFVDGVNGNDSSGDGTYGSPVKTFEKAKEILEEQIKATQVANSSDSIPDGIYVLNTITVSNTVSWSLDDLATTYSLTGEPVFKLMRYTGFTGTLVEVANGGELTLSEITIDGLGEKAAPTKALIQVDSGATLNITGGAVLQNNIRTSSYAEAGGAVYATGGTVNMTEGTIQNCSAYWGGGIGLNSATLEMSGGTITQNTAVSAGGGCLPDLWFYDDYECWYYLLQ